MQYAQSNKIVLMSHFSIYLELLTKEVNLGFKNGGSPLNEFFFLVKSIKWVSKVTYIFHILNSNTVGLELDVTFKKLFIYLVRIVDKGD